MTGERERLPRLLSLVPYLQAHPGVAIATAAADFGVSEAAASRPATAVDVRAARTRARRSHRPVVRGDSVSVIFDAGISRPLRLTAEEALALVVALRTLMETPGLTDRAAVRAGPGQG